MEIQRDRMVHLGYARYWRSDDIVGLLPIEEDRGPGRRTEVYVSGRDAPVVASRAEETILEDMVLDEDARVESPEVRQTMRDLVEAFRGLSPVLRRMLRTEGNFDVGAWIGRLQRLDPQETGEDAQEELFPGG